MNIFTKTTVLAVSLLSLAGVSYANVNTKSFDQLDKNKDGVLDKKETRAARGLDFKTADTDNNGSISQTEYQTAMAHQGSSRDQNPATSGSMSDMDSGMKSGSSVGTETPGNRSSSSDNSSSSSAARY